jgi:anti-sigma regulatory factor (Ser/Thr protein kinase)
MATPQAQGVVTVRTFTQRLSATRRGARLARRFASQQLDAWGIPSGSDASDAVALVVAELAANAVLHGRVPGRDFELRLVHVPARGLVRVEVSDTHPGQPSTCKPEPPAGDAVHGRGLVLVAATAVRWGVCQRHGPGKAVWAEVACQPN